MCLNGADSNGRIERTRHVHTHAADSPQNRPITRIRTFDLTRLNFFTRSNFHTYTYVFAYVRVHVNRSRRALISYTVLCTTHLRYMIDQWSHRDRRYWSARHTHTRTYNNHTYDILS